MKAIFVHGENIGVTELGFDVEVKAMHAQKCLYGSGHEMKRVTVLKMGQIDSERFS